MSEKTLIYYPPIMYYYLYNYGVRTDAAEMLPRSPADLPKVFPDYWPRSDRRFIISTPLCNLSVSNQATNHCCGAREIGGINTNMGGSLTITTYHQLFTLVEELEEYGLASQSRFHMQTTYSRDYLHPLRESGIPALATLADELDEISKLEENEEDEIQICNYSTRQMKKYIRSIKRIFNKFYTTLPEHRVVSQPQDGNLFNALRYVLVRPLVYIEWELPGRRCGRTDKAADQDILRTYEYLVNKSMKLLGLGAGSLLTGAMSGNWILFNQFMSHQRGTGRQPLLTAASHLNAYLGTYYGIDKMYLYDSPTPSKSLRKRTPSLESRVIGAVRAGGYLSNFDIWGMFNTDWARWTMFQYGVPNFRYGSNDRLRMHQIAFYPDDLHEAMVWGAQQVDDYYQHSLTGLHYSLLNYKASHSSPIVTRGIEYHSLYKATQAM